MKKVFILQIFIFFLPFMGFSQKKESMTGMAKRSNFLSPLGFQDRIGYSKYLLGGSGKYIKYKNPDFNIRIEPSLPYKDSLPYKELLNSGLTSLLFEYKNYDGVFSESNYLIFACGNYKVVYKDLLKFINNRIFTNQKFLMIIYNWIKPYYEGVFNELTYNEQILLKNKLLLAEKYIELIIVERKENKFNEFLSENGLENDERLTGFFKRRIMKKQWTVADCKSWIERIKKDMPALKNPNHPSSHFQITSEIQPNLFIACNDIGKYFLLDKQYQKLSDAWDYIEKGPANEINLYRTKREDDLFHFYIGDRGELIKPTDANWMEWKYLNDTSISFKKRTDINGSYSGYYEGTFYTGSKKEFIKVRSVLVGFDEKKIGRIYNEQGALLSEQEFQKQCDTILIPNLDNPDKIIEDINCIDIPLEFLNQDKWIIFRNLNNQYGLIDLNGKILLPFHYAFMYTNDEQDKIMAGEEISGAEIIFNIVEEKLEKIK